MTKREFIRSLMEDVNLLREDAAKIYDIVCKQIRKKLLEGQEVRIDGVGRFYFKHNKGGTIRSNLHEGKLMKVEPRIKLKFLPFPKMKRDVTRTLVRREK